MITFFLIFFLFKWRRLKMSPVEIPGGNFGWIGGWIVLGYSLLIVYLIKKVMEDEKRNR